MAKRGENIYKRKDGRYEGRYVTGRRADGKTLFGYIYAYSYAEVKQALTLAKASARQSGAVRIIGKGTLAEYLKWWLENVMRECVKPSTYAQYQERVINRIIPALGGITVRSLSRERVQEFINALCAKGLAASTVKNIAGLLRSAMKKAAELDLISGNPCDGVTVMAGEVRERPALNRAEQIRLEKSASLAGQAVDIGVVLGLYSGLRIGEICALRWRDVDLMSGTLTVRGTLQRIRLFDCAEKTALYEGAPKSKRSGRCVPLPADVSEKLRGCRQGASDDSFVLTGGACPMEPRTLRGKFKRAAERAGLNIPFHCLRHTYAARCLEYNFDIQALSELLGHAAASTTMAVYAHSVLEHKRMLTSRMCILSQMLEPSNKPSAALAAC